MGVSRTPPSMTALEKFLAAMAVSIKPHRPAMSFRLPQTMTETELGVPVSMALGIAYQRVGIVIGLLVHARFNSRWSAR